MMVICHPYVNSIKTKFNFCLFLACQQLSYANAEIGQSLIRSTHATLISNSTTVSPPVTTSAKSSFFNGIRNIFVRTTTVATTTTTNKVHTARPVTYAVTSPKPHTTPSTLHNHGSVTPALVHVHPPVNSPQNPQNSESVHKADNWPSLPASRGSQSFHSSSNSQQHGSRIPVRQPTSTIISGAGPSHFIQPNIEISKRGDTHIIGICYYYCMITEI